MNPLSILTQAFRLLRSALTECLILSIIAIPVVWAGLEVAQRGGNLETFRLLMTIPQMVWGGFSAVVLYNAFENEKTGEEYELPIKDLAFLTAMMAVLGFLNGLVIGVGSMMCLIPGIIASLGLMLGQVILFKEDVNILDAMSRSWSMTHGYKLDLLYVTVVFTMVVMVVAVPSVFAVMFVLYGDAMDGGPSILGNAILSVGLGVGATVLVGLFRALEFTVYEHITRPVPRPSRGYVEPPPPENEPVQQSRPPAAVRPPITVDSDIVFGQTEDDD